MGPKISNDTARFLYGVHGLIVITSIVVGRFFCVELRMGCGETKRFITEAIIAIWKGGKCVGKLRQPALMRAEIHVFARSRNKWYWPGVKESARQ